MKNVRLAMAALVLLAAPAARAQLSGEGRTMFVAGFRKMCLRTLTTDDRFSGVTRSTLVSMCSCAGPRLADTIDPTEMRAEMGRSPEEREAWMTGLDEDALIYCINRHGGFMPGMTVTPNK